MSSVTYGQWFKCSSCGEAFHFDKRDEHYVWCSVIQTIKKDLLKTAIELQELRSGKNKTFSDVEKSIDQAWEKFKS